MGVCGLVIAKSALSAATTAAKVLVPAQLIIGDNDPTAKAIRPKPALIKAPAMVPAIPGAAKTTTVLLARNGGHSLRFNSSDTHAEKELACASADTEGMDACRGGTCRGFFLSQL